MPPKWPHLPGIKSGNIEFLFLLETTQDPRQWELYWLENGGKAPGRLSSQVWPHSLSQRLILALSLAITWGKTVHLSVLRNSMFPKRNSLTFIFPILDDLTPPFCRSMALLFCSLWSLPLFRSKSICNCCVPQSAGFPATDCSDLPAAQLNPHPHVQMYFPQHSQDKGQLSPPAPI